MRMLEKLRDVVSGVDACLHRYLCVDVKSYVFRDEALTDKIVRVEALAVKFPAMFVC